MNGIVNQFAQLTLLNNLCSGSGLVIAIIGCNKNVYRVLPEEFSVFRIIGGLMLTYRWPDGDL